MFQFIVDKIKTCTQFLRQSTSLNENRVFNIHEDFVADKFPPGSKAAILCEIASLGFPVPPGIYIL
jgi:hypothetical protein